MAGSKGERDPRAGCLRARAEVEGAAQTGGAFTTDARANELIENSANAFLLGVLFTQGIPAERAWAGPFRIQQRLGTLDLTFLAENPEAVRDAVQRAPMLHRFKETLPRWIQPPPSGRSTSTPGMPRTYGRPGTSVLEVTERLSAFQGIGRRRRSPPPRSRRGTSAPNLPGGRAGRLPMQRPRQARIPAHGSGQRDSRTAIEAAASAAFPEAPGTLDLPAWLIGRETCRPKAPLCDQCRLGAVCPRLVERNVEGVGVRRGART